MKQHRSTSYMDRDNIRSRGADARAPRYDSFSGVLSNVPYRPARSVHSPQDSVANKASQDARQSPTHNPSHTQTADTSSKHMAGSNNAARKQSPHVVHKRTASRSNVLQRNAVKKPRNVLSPTQKSANKSQRRHKSLRSLRVRPRYALMMTGLFLLFGIGGSLAAYAINTKQSSSANVLSEQTETTPVRSEQMSADFVSEEPRTEADLRDHTVAANAPRILHIDSISVSARIVPTSVDIGNRLIAPDNIYDIGWYEGSREPGKSGVVLLNGHVSGANDRGVLYYARAMEPGDVIELERGDGTRHAYEVMAKQRISYNDVDTTALLVPYESNKNGLHLVAVDNRFNVLSNEFQDRLVVYAVEI